MLSLLSHSWLHQIRDFREVDITTLIPVSSTGAINLNLVVLLNNVWHPFEALKRAEAFSVPGKVFRSLEIGTAAGF